MTMHSGLESRVPFLHNDLVDYILSCNLDSFYSPENPKLILKDFAIKNTPLTKELIYRPKVGFPIDLMKVFSSKYPDTPLSVMVKV